jgi:hypothetical protein
MIPLAPNDNIFIPDDNISSQMITLTPDDNISSQMITSPSQMITFSPR